MILGRTPRSLFKDYAKKRLHFMIRPNEGCLVLTFEITVRLEAHNYLVRKRKRVRKIYTVRFL